MLAKFSYAKPFYRLALAVFCATLASRAVAACVEAPDPSDLELQLMRCDDGVVIASETTTARSPAARMARHPRVLQLDDGALAISLPPSSTPFQAQAPDVVASSHEGVWALLSENGRTTAMTWGGVVTLRSRVDDSATSLRAGGSAPDARVVARLERLHRALERAAGRP